LALLLQKWRVTLRVRLRVRQETNNKRQNDAAKWQQQSKKQREPRYTGSKKATPKRQRESHGQQAAKKTRPDGTHKRLPWNNALSFGLPDSILASLAFLPPFVGTIVEKG
jgi:hypothetical protein